MINSSIEDDLLRYIDKIYNEGLFNKNNERVNAEDIFCRLFKLIYNWSDLKNLNYSEPNSAGIDIYSEQKGIAIQITTIQSSELDKIEKTVEKILRHHATKKIKGVICFFVKDKRAIKNLNEESLSKKFGKKIKIRTSLDLIGDINRFSTPAKRKRIEEIVKQELSPEFNGLSNLNSFKPFDKVITSTEYITPENAIYFSEFEKNKIKEIALLFNKNKTKEYSILGNPCSGKSTFTKAIVRNLIPYYKTYTLDLSNPDLNHSRRDLMMELNQLSFYHSIVILENVHDNVNLFKELRQKIVLFEWIKGIYISRYYNSFREEDKNSILNVFKDIYQFRYNPDFEFEQKVSGIIDNRIRHLKKEYPDFTWYKGDFKTILKNTDSNLLKLNIALETWISSNKKGKNLKLDQVNNDNIYSYFFDAHKLNEFNTELLFLYSYLFSHDISFLRVKGKNEEFTKLKEKGIILNYTTSDYYYFPHKDYASLIHLTLTKEKDLETTYLIELLINYLDKHKTESELNITEIVIKLYASAQFEIVKALLNEAKVLELISIKFDSNIRNYEVFELQKIFFHSFDILNNKNQSAYYNLFIKYYSKSKLELYLSKDYSVYSNLLQIANQLNKELGGIIKTLRPNEQANTNSITELTMRISKKKATPETVNRILNSFHFPEWLSMIEKLPTLSRITNSLSELNTSPLSKKLLLGIIRNLNIQKLVKKGNSLKTVQIGKSIRELEKIDIALGTNIAKKLLDQLSLNINTSNTNLSDFSKSLSDLSSIAPDLVNLELKKSFGNGTFHKLLEKEQSLSNISARLLELNTTIDSEKEIFHEIINQFFISTSFKKLLNSEQNINSLLIFYELVKKNEIGITQISQNDILYITKEQILKIDFDITILSNPKVLNIQELKEKVKNEISAELLNKVIYGSKFTVIESLFLVLTRVDKEKTVNALNMSDLNIFCNSMCHNELNISQSTEVLNKTKNKTFVNDNLNSNLFCSNLLDKYLTIQRADQYQYGRLNFGDYLKAFDYSLKIDFKIAIKHFENDFLKKLKISNNKNLTISSLFQSLRRIEQLTDSKYNKEIRAFLKLYKAKFLTGIKNENLAKTTSGLVELSKCDLKDFADELLYDSKNVVLNKIRQLNGDKILNAKIFPDIEKIAIGKAKILLTEIKTSR
ncbi:hypothetical protein APS56_04690 [Pseudalgibacter alginicilyticus]|uniref:SMEK domain-containing protein n=1 Tax=Pseudalgibacter alginicilyticus TaxID=1736674 RepID=A0A0P0D0V0_9FLAO|nr:SMEK domain-containing protein [Pseudalgibacter alginicilyticus]ALJ04479.1 hypothetical protein APS56_04690 [Pseudalgibacter alginicilyticus]